MAYWDMPRGVLLNDAQHALYEQVNGLARTSRANGLAILLGWYEAGHIDLEDAYAVAVLFGEPHRFADMLEEAGF
jgi:hypothetical protein